MPETTNHNLLTCHFAREVWSRVQRILENTMRWPHGQLTRDKVVFHESNGTGTEGERLVHSILVAVKNGIYRTRMQASLPTTRTATNLIRGALTSLKRTWQYIYGQSHLVTEMMETLPP